MHISYNVSDCVCLRVFMFMMRMGKRGNIDIKLKLKCIQRTEYGWRPTCVLFETAMANKEGCRRCHRYHLRLCASQLQGNKRELEKWIGKRAWTKRKIKRQKKGQEIGGKEGWTRRGRQQITDRPVFVISTHTPFEPYEREMRHPTNDRSCKNRLQLLKFTSECSGMCSGVVGWI